MIIFKRFGRLIFAMRRQRSLSWLAGWTKQTISMATLQRDPAQGEEFRLWPSVFGADARIAHAHRSLQSELSRMDPHGAGLLHVLFGSSTFIRHIGP